MFEVSINDLLKLGLVENIGRMTQIDSAQAKIIIEYLITHGDKKCVPNAMTIPNIEDSFGAYFTLIMILLPQRLIGFSEFDKLAPVICGKPEPNALDVKCFSIGKVVDQLKITDELIDVVENTPDDSFYKENIVILSLEGKVTIDPTVDIHKVNTFLDKCFSAAANRVIRENLMK